jgi:hypothetical protein
MEESKREQKLPRNALHKRSRDAGSREQASEFGHIWAHRFEDEADMFTIGPDVLKVVDKPENVLRP